VSDLFESRHNQRLVHFFGADLDNELVAIGDRRGYLAVGLVFFVAFFVL
jgi:hypothetical protein